MQVACRICLAALLLAAAPPCFSSLILDGRCAAGPTGNLNSLVPGGVLNNPLTAEVQFQSPRTSVQSSTAVRLYVEDSQQLLLPPASVFAIAGESATAESSSGEFEEDRANKFSRWQMIRTGGFAAYDPQRFAANGNLALWECVNTRDFENELPYASFRAARALPKPNAIHRQQHFQTTLQLAGTGPFNLLLTPLRAGGGMYVRTPALRRWWNRTPAVRSWWKMRGRYGLE